MGIGRTLAVLLAALVALGPVHARDKKKKHHDEDTPAQVEPPAKAESPAPAEPGEPPHAAPRPPPRVSLDRVIEQIERRYKARVVRVDKSEDAGQLTYVLRLMSDQRVWTVKVDSETGKEK